MFSGIIADLGRVTRVAPRGDGLTVILRCGLPISGARPGVILGDSIAVMGACLTVEALSAPDTFTVACGRETLDRTTLGELRVGDRVHLERALCLGDRLDGHLVSGHVDGVGTIRARQDAAESIVLWIDLPLPLQRYVAEKGSITVDGVSLTVNEVDSAGFRVNLIPYTQIHTVLAERRPGDRVNLEVDLVARYVERLLGDRPLRLPGGLTRERLEALGFISLAKEP